MITASRREIQRLLRPIVERAVEEALEDRLDVVDALEALREPGTLTADELRARLGL